MTTDLVNELLQYNKILSSSVVCVDGFPYIRLPPHEIFLAASCMRQAAEEIERLRALLYPECPGCGLRPNLEHGGVVWCDECAGEIECLRHLNYEMRGLLDTVCDAWEEAEVIPDTFNRCRRVWLQDWYVNTRKLIK